MRDAIKNKDFGMLCELTIKDSNNFHAICRDTYPTISYLNDTSNFIIKCVEQINKLYEKPIVSYKLM
jgi:diphosphomevalonate decarboxylase